LETARHWTCSGVGRAREARGRGQQPRNRATGVAKKEPYLVGVPVEELLLLQVSNVSDNNSRSERIDDGVRLVVHDEAIVDASAEADDRVKSK